MCAVESDEVLKEKPWAVSSPQLAVGVSANAEMALCFTQPAPNRGVSTGVLLNQDPLIQTHRVTAGQSQDNVFEHQPRLGAEHRRLLELRTD